MGDAIPAGYRSAAGTRLGQGLRRGVPVVRALLDAQAVARQGGDHIAYAHITALVNSIPVVTEFMRRSSGEQSAIVSATTTTAKQLARKLGYGAKTTRKNPTTAATISKRIVSLVDQGVPIGSAVDAVLGAGTYTRIVDDIWTALRAQEGQHPTPAQVRKAMADAAVRAHTKKKA